MPRTSVCKATATPTTGPGGSRVEQGFFAAEGLRRRIPGGQSEGRRRAACRISRERWKESQLQQGALEVYPVCEWGAIERVQQLGGGKIIGLDTTVRTGAIMVRKDSKVQSLAQICATCRSP